MPGEIACLLYWGYYLGGALKDAGGKSADQLPPGKAARREEEPSRRG
ncbi:MAG TPA: hypothetical protein VN154_04250 [Rhizomicrobium sp.]|nr:hypothetical protein [Rhizomicrobium sp.]